MAIAGTGTGPFTITGTETTLAIFNAVVSANVANATKNSDNSMFDFNCVLNVGDGTTATLWNPVEQHIRIDASQFVIAANATFRAGLANPARAGGYIRINCGGDAFLIRGTFQGYASRVFSAGRVKATSKAVVYFEECLLALLDGIDNGNGVENPNIQYVRCNFAGATAVAVKLGGTISLTGCKISGALHAFQPLGVSGQSPVYNVDDYVGQSNTNDAVPNVGGANTQLNIRGAFDGATGLPRTGLITTAHAVSNTVRLQWRYNLQAIFDGAGIVGAQVRIRNNAGTTVYSGLTDANGRIPQQILNRVEYINNSTAQNRFPYEIIVRAYDRSSQTIVWQADNHTSASTLHGLVNTTLTQTQAAALTGIICTASGATGGTVTISENRTTSEVWDAFRNWISQTANFDSDDTWTFDGTTLNTGAWNVTVDAGDTLTGNVTTTGTVTGTVNGVVLDANNAGVISVQMTSTTDTAEMRRVSDNSLIATRTGAGSFAIAPALVGVAVYFERKTGSALVMSTITTPVTLTAGINPSVPLYAGAEVQVAQAGRIDLLPTAADVWGYNARTLTSSSFGGATLAEIEASTILAKKSDVQVVGAAVAALPAPLTSIQTQDAAAAALVAYDAVVPSDLAGLALESSVQSRAAQTSVNAIPTNTLLATDARLGNLDAAISTRSTLTAPQVRTELAPELGRLDVAVSTRLAESAYTAPTPPPTAAQNATAVRTELAVELAKVDAPVSSMATLQSVNALATANQAEHDATQIAIASLPAAIRADQSAELAKVNALPADIPSAVWSHTQ